LRREAGVTGEYGVAHPRWQCYEVRKAEVRADFGALYGGGVCGIVGEGTGACAAGGGVEGGDTDGRGVSVKQWLSSSWLVV
jgi:hypothetical protein